MSEIGHPESTNAPFEYPRACAHPKCSCVVDSIDGDEKFCSAECRAGDGCTHPGCDCEERTD